MRRNYLQGLIAIIAIIVPLHYYFSTYLLNFYFEQFGLDYANIKSLDDIQFMFARINGEFLYVTIVEFTAIFVSYHVLQKLKEVFQRGRERRKILIIEDKLPKRKPFNLNVYRLRKLKLSLIIIFLLLFILSFLIYLHGLEWSLALNLGIVAMLSLSVCVFLKQGVVAFVCLLFGNVYVSYKNIMNVNDLNIYTNDIKLELTDGDIVQSDSVRRLIFYGAKNVILYNDTAKTAIFYPVDKIKSVEWINHK